MRYRIVLFIFSIFWIVMALKLNDISTLVNYYKEKAKENSQREDYIKPVRGEIFDKNNTLLATNKIGFSILIMPNLKKESLKDTINTLMQNFPKLNEKLLFKVYKQKNSYYNHKPIKVVDFIPAKKIFPLFPKLNQNRNLKVVLATKRYYPFNELTAHIIGYIGKTTSKDDEIASFIGKEGKSGIENYYNDILQGELGTKLYRVNALNKEIELLKKIPPIENQSIKLTIDINLQKKLFSLFRDKNITGVAIVMKTNGEILGAVSTPSYNPNLFSKGIPYKVWDKLQNDPNHPFTNKIINGLYPAGSTIKMGVALAFDDLNRKPEKCKGHIKLGKNNHKFRCWAEWGHGKVTLRRAIRESCDVYFYNKSLILGINKISKTLKSLGLGEYTGVDLPYESKGVVPNKEWKRKKFHKPWFIGETVISSIGQGYTLVTPIQLAKYTATIATSKIVTPHFVKEIEKKNIQPKIEDINLSKEYLSEIRKGMFDVCNHKRGTAFKTMSLLPIIVAGKTATSQVSSIPQSTKIRLKEKELEYFKRSHAWITSYAPFNKPKYIVTVLVEHGGHGGSSSGPLASEIYQWLYKNNYFKSKKKGIKDD